MSQKDHAIIVGVGRYRDKNVQALKGARADARRFYEWVTSADGGAVPPENVRLFAADQAPEDACYEELADAFVSLCLPAKESAYLGRRLYIYLAGHGFAQNLHEASLLAADGGPNAPECHIPGWHWMTWFCLSAYFEEVVLFADCCRTASGDWAVRPFPLDEVHSQAAGRVRWVRGFATYYGAVSLELQAGEGQGLFTSALVEALKHARQADGRVTTSSVREYLQHHPALQKVRNRQVPSLFGEGEVVFSDGPVQHAQVRVIVSNGAPPTIEGGPPPGQWSVRPGERPGEFQVELPRGLYAAKLAGRLTKFFEVTRVPGSVDVSF